MDHIPIRHINNSELEPNLVENFRIRDVGQLLGGKEMTQELHRHDFFFVLALKKGSGFHTIDFQPVTVGDHSVFFMRPGQVHQLTLNAGCTGYLMEFKNDFYFPQDTFSKQLLRKATKKSPSHLDSQAFERVFAILSSIYQEYRERRENFQEVIKASLGIFIIELVRNRQNQRNQSNAVSPYAQERVEEFLDLLEANVVSQKQVSHYAELLNLSTYQLNAITKTTLGKTSSELIDDYIILESKRNLLATSNQVNQIAYQLGYEDVSYFIRFFKKHTGHSPESFRQSFK